jgi:hypothetical protein
MGGVKAGVLSKRIPRYTQQQQNDRKTERQKMEDRVRRWKSLGSWMMVEKFSLVG